MNAAALAKLILDQAVSVGGDTWGKIKTAAPIFVRGYAQTLLETAKAAASGDISVADAKQFARNAKFLLSQGIANMAHIVLFAVQSFMNGVLNAVKSAINAALPIAIL